MLRITPPPGIELHVGTLREALINTLVARQRGEGLLLRFDDTDPTHSERGHPETIKQLLEKFAVQPERTHYRSERLGRYQQLAVALVERGEAFLCICGEKEPEHEGAAAPAEESPRRYSGRCLGMEAQELRRIREEKIPYTIRIRKPLESICFTDGLRGEVCASPSEVDHFVLLRADGKPSSLFAEACDDMLDGISTVIAGEDDLPRTPRRIHALRSLGYAGPIGYLHLPPLLDGEGRRFTGRDDRGSVRGLLEEGFLPDAIINHLLELGCEPPTEIFTLPDAVEWFDPEKLSVEPVRFDPERLRYLNREHLRRMDDRTLSRIFGFADEDIGRLAKVYLQETSSINGLMERIRTLFAPKTCEGRDGDAMRRLSALILDAPYMESFDEFVRYLSRHSDLEGDALAGPLRRLLTGADSGPELGEIYPHIKFYITEIARCQH